jgi:hypothetical protein
MNNIENNSSKTMSIKTFPSNLPSKKTRKYGVTKAQRIPCSTHSPIFRAIKLGMMMSKSCIERNDSKRINMLCRKEEMRKALIFAQVKSLGKKPMTGSRSQ